jgi:hypothetical protein
VKDSERKKRDEIKNSLQTLIDDESIAQALVLVIFTDGKSFSADSGLTVAEAKKIMAQFEQWLDRHGSGN